MKGTSKIMKSSKSCLRHRILDIIARWTAPSRMEESIKEDLTPGMGETTRQPSPQSLDNMKKPRHVENDAESSDPKIRKKIEELMEKARIKQPHLSLENNDYSEYKSLSEFQTSQVPRGDQKQFLGPSYGDPNFYAQSNKLKRIAAKLPCTCKL